MNNQNTTHHQPEITRLNGIINALLCQISVLEEENKQLKGANASLGTFPSYHQKHVVGNGIFHSNQDFDVGRVETPASAHPNMIGGKETSHSYHAGMTGSGINIPDGEKNVIGMRESNAPYDLRMIGSGKVNATDAMEMPGRINSVASAAINQNMELPDTITSWCETVFKKVLKNSGMKKVKNSGLERIIDILVHLYNKKSSHHRELKRLTGLSEGGRAKLIMSMKRRGLVQRARFGCYTLAPGGRSLLQKCYAASEAFMNNTTEQGIVRGFPPRLA